MRAWLFSAVNRHVGPEAGWTRQHITTCPRCQRRLISSGKAHLALTFIKSQPHGFDLLTRANKQTVSVLKHSLRAEPKAQKLQTQQPEPAPLEKYGKYGFSIGSLAACLAILVLMKIGLFSSMDTVHTKGQKVIKQYYAKQVGQDLADEVFARQTDSTA